MYSYLAGWRSTHMTLKVWAGYFGEHQNPTRSLIWIVNARKEVQGFRWFQFQIQCPKKQKPNQKMKCASITQKPTLLGKSHIRSSKAGPNAKIDSSTLESHSFHFCLYSRYRYTSRLKATAVITMTIMPNFLKDSGREALAFFPRNHGHSGRKALLFMLQPYLRSISA